MLDFRLTHDGRLWKAEHQELEAQGATLQALDLSLAKALRERGQRGKGESVQVRMTFDSSTIPQWIRQYASHYFNRIVTLNLEHAPCDHED